ncbi:MAG TPA: hypothetical protein VFQ88_09590 [Nevskiaceae bacterium]|nr:hypothetical protein [Nevskiaceae bacterium]
MKPTLLARAVACALIATVTGAALAAPPAVGPKPGPYASGPRHGPKPGPFAVGPRHEPVAKLGTAAQISSVSAPPPIHLSLPAIVSPDFLATLTAAQAQAALLQQELTNAKLKAAIAKVNAPPPAPAPAPTLPPQMLANAIHGRQSTTVALPMLGGGASSGPSLVGTAVQGDRRVATFSNDGTSVNATTGSVLPSGWTVTSITSTAATLTKGRAVKHLSLSH